MDLILSTVKSASFASNTIALPYTDTHIALVYDNTMKGDPLRKFLFHGTHGFDDEDGVVTAITDQTKEYAEELIRHLLMSSKVGDIPRLPWERDPCAYHLHPSNPPGYSCTRSAYAVSFPLEV